MKYSEMIRLIKAAGYTFLRTGKGSHEFWQRGDQRVLIARGGIRTQGAKQIFIKQISTAR